MNWDVFKFLPNFLFVSRTDSGRSSVSVPWLDISHYSGEGWLLLFTGESGNRVRIDRSLARRGAAVVELARRGAVVELAHRGAVVELARWVAVVELAVVPSSSLRVVMPSSSWHVVIL
jgi:hypothetical protein